MRAVITVIGKDKIGIIAGISNILADCNVNILDISQTIMQDVFYHGDACRYIQTMCSVCGVG